MPLLEAILFTPTCHPFLPFAIEGVKWIPAIGWASGRFPPHLRASPQCAFCFLLWTEDETKWSLAKLEGTTALIVFRRRYS